jgi:uncharacterized membrane protein
VTAPAMATASSKAGITTDSQGAGTRRVYGVARAGRRSG